jgi:hypothetical protein
VPRPEAEASCPAKNNTAFGERSGEFDYGNSAFDDRNECPTRKRAQLEENLDRNAEVEERLCKAPRCTTSLTTLNSSGSCSRHLHFSRRKSNLGNGQAHKGSAEEKSSSTVDREAINLANGHAPNTAHDFREDRLNHLILGRSLDLKTRLATEWLRGNL